MSLTRQQRRQIEAIKKAIEEYDGERVNPAFEEMKRQVGTIIIQKRSEIVELSNAIADMLPIEERLGRILKIRERLTGVTSSMFSKLVHMLGADHKKVSCRGYRNYYVAATQDGAISPDMLKLEELGYVKRGKYNTTVGFIPEPVFYATEKGINLVGLGYDKDGKITGLKSKWVKGVKNDDRANT